MDFNAIFASIGSFFEGLGASLPAATAQGLFWGIMAIGVFITFRVLDIADLTVDGSFATGGAVFAVLLTAHVPAGFAMPIAFCAGVLAGLITGLLHTKLGIPAILAGILTQLALYTINLRIQGMRSQLTISSRNYKLFIVQKNCTNLDNLLLDNTILRLVLLAAFLVTVLCLFFSTEYGSSLRSAGANPQMSRAQGINVDSRKLVGLMISNGFVALAGCINAQFNGSSLVDSGRGSIVIGLAAIIIAETLFSKIFRTMALKLIGILIGGIIYYYVMQVVLQAGLDPADLKLLIATVVAVFLGIPYLKKQITERSFRKNTKVVKDTNA